MKKINIAIICQPIDSVLPPVQNSIGILIYEFARRLAQKNASVTVFSRGRRFRHQKVIFRDGVRFKFVPVGYDVLLHKILRKFSKAGDPDMPFFASKLYYGVYAVITALRLRFQKYDIAHVVNFSQFVSIIRAFNPGLKIVLHMECEWVSQLSEKIMDTRLAKTDLILGCSHYITGQITDKYPRHRERCHTLHNPVDEEYFKIADEGGSSGKNGRPTLLFVGRISPEKGVHVLLDAMAAVVKEHSNVLLLLAGATGRLPREYLLDISNDRLVKSLALFYEDSSDVSYYETLKNKIDKFNLEDNVSFVGSIPNLELKEFYIESDVFVFPPVWNEPFGIPPVEAMSMGIPVIGTRSGGLNETVENGKTGILVDKNNPEELANAIKSLLSNNKLRSKMGRAGRERVLHYFTYDMLVDELWSFYKKLLTSINKSETSLNKPG
jgi:glycosyltransferase involved in cell wall biosynthesis